MRAISTIPLIAILLMTMSCRTNEKTGTAIKGKFMYRYQSGLEVVGTFDGNNHLAWECVKGPAKGQTGEEVIQSEEVAGNIYFVSWLEKSGTSVSQIIDLNEWKGESISYFRYGSGKAAFLRYRYRGKNFRLNFSAFFLLVGSFRSQHAA